jgi:hypothetical protein
MPTIKLIFPTPRENGGCHRFQQIAQFKQQVKNCRVVELPDTDHFCFIQRQGEVVRQMQTFLN